MNSNGGSKKPGKTSPTSASDVNPARAAVTQFSAPTVAEAVDRTLDLANCPDGAHVVTGSDIKANVLDLVTLTWQGTTADGQAAGPYVQTQTIAGPFDVNKPVKFDPVPLAQITALAGGTVGMSYTVIADNGLKTGASRVNTLQVRGQGKPQAMFKVRGCRGGSATGTPFAPGSLVAVDGVTGLPVTAQWQYEGDTRSVTAERLIDSSPAKILTVTVNSAVVRLAPVSIAKGDLGSITVRLDDGTVASWRYIHDFSVPVNYLPADLATTDNIVAVFGNRAGYVALCRDGSGLTWNNPVSDDYVPPDIAALRDIVSITAAYGAFTVLRSDGSVVVWGQKDKGGTVPSDIAVLRDIVSVTASAFAFAALRRDGSVVAWGDTGRGGSVPPLIASLHDVVSIFGGYLVFVALRSNGSVVAWGDSDYGGIVPPDIAALRDIASITASNGTLVALRSGGSMVGWGELAGSTDGGGVPQYIAALGDVVSVVGSDRAFAALRRNGSVVTWGDSDYGGWIPVDIGRLRDIVCVCASPSSFAAIRRDGSVWSWSIGGTNSSYVTHSSSTLAVYCYTFPSPDFLCLDEEHRVSTLGDSYANPEAIQGRVTWTL